MSNQFDKLPSELVFMILSHVPVPSLISFGATSKNNYLYHTLCMNRLHLAVFYRRVHATAAFLGASSRYCAKESTDLSHCMILESHKLRVILPQNTTTYSPPGRLAYYDPPAKRHKKKRTVFSENKVYVYSASSEQTIRTQNRVFASIVNRYGQSLHDLEFLAYDLNNEGAIAVGTSCGAKLHHLAFRFEHPYVRDMTLSQKYWSTPAPGNTAWNALIGVGPSKKGMNITNLESLILERAGITPWQLRMLVKRNRKLKVLKLKTCAGVQPGFVNWLGGIPIPDDDEDDDGDESVPGASIAVLWVDNCDGIRTRKSKNNDKSQGIDAGLEWVGNLKALEVRKALHDNKAGNPFMVCKKY